MSEVPLYRVVLALRRGLRVQVSGLGFGVHTRALVLRFLDFCITHLQT